MLLQGLHFSLQGKPTTSDLFVCSPSVNELAGSIPLHCGICGHYSTTLWHLWAWFSDTKPFTYFVFATNLVAQAKIISLGPITHVCGASEHRTVWRK